VLQVDKVKTWKSGWRNRGSTRNHEPQGRRANEVDPPITVEFEESVVRAGQNAVGQFARGAHFSSQVFLDQYARRALLPLSWDRRRYRSLGANLPGSFGQIGEAAGVSRIRMAASQQSRDRQFAHQFCNLEDSCAGG
jgi:hypothetical protein